MIQIEQQNNKDIVIFDENGLKTIRNFQSYFYIRDEQGEHISLFGEKCRKIICDDSYLMFKEKAKYSETFEADVDFRSRYLIDNVQVPIPKSNLHIVYLDIETNFSINAEQADKEITCITIYSTKLGKYITFVWRQDLEKKKVNEVYFFNKEKEMLLNFIKCVN
ncbi:MAG: hypothetical protein AABY22_31585, partial [Nanoarchaeota archaeon]